MTASFTDAKEFALSLRLSGEFSDLLQLDPDTYVPVVLAAVEQDIRKALDKERAARNTGE